MAFLRRPAAPLLSEKDLRAKPERLLETFTRQCIRVQLEHLFTHPSVEAAASAGKVTVSGAYYDIGAGKISRVSRRRG